MEKTLPQNCDAEEWFLGAILFEPHMLDTVKDIVRSQDFYRDSHQIIYTAMLSVDARNMAPDVIAVGDELARLGKLEAIGGMSQLFYLSSQVLGAGRAEEHARIIRAKSEYRGLIAAAGRIAALAYEETPNALELAEQMIYQISQGTTSSDLLPLSSVMASFLSDLDRRNSDYGRIVGLPTGFFDMDYLVGGLQRGELIILGGRPGEGKTSFMLNLLYNLLFTFQKNMVLFSLEMSKTDVARRLVSMDAGIDSQHLRNRTLSPDDWDKVLFSVNRLSDDHLFVDESGKLSIASLRSKCRRHKQKYGLDIVVVDYLQLMSSDIVDEKRRIERRLEVDEVSRGLKQLARELDVPVLACASLSRAVEGRSDPTPKLSDLRESGSIESDADIVMFIRRSRERAGYSILNIEKHRNGPVGEVTLKFDARLTKFSDVDEAITETEEGTH